MRGSLRKLAQKWTIRASFVTDCRLFFFSFARGAVGTHKIRIYICIFFSGKKNCFRYYYISKIQNFYLFLFKKKTRASLSNSRGRVVCCIETYARTQWISFSCTPFWNTILPAIIFYAGHLGVWLLTRGCAAHTHTHTPTVLTPSRRFLLEREKRSLFLPAAAPSSCSFQVFYYFYTSRRARGRPTAVRNT